MLSDADMLIHYLYAILPTSTVIYTLIMSCLALLGWRLRNMKHNMSVKTYKMHKSLTISLCFQFALPACMLACSEICFCMSAILQVDSARTIFYVSYIFSTLHTFANGIIMIAFVKPYREACFSMLRPLLEPIRRRFFPKKRKTTLVVSQELTTRSTFTQPIFSNKTKRIAPMRGLSSRSQ
ncbi:serpentine type 7TM GPCR chemoreceptor srh domain-containing protein [Ditylenchus destructor]|uniref:Serpentine type 7TM GPCR chemoreceptor srh domain-containing protein n=1 Tax=Ditylenchus destructor TaxID=166010 RepID=A0AAD4R1M5_9BILA|nr:serpentine type 7TM GPCR chemoreceptor srh domain-containing protein [Ditylenchus destructor]